ncbi:hypothetical protein ABDK96_02075 [Citricoccus nitrophenolicus]|uniref:DUF3168 domain-containing protein n=1 Tax=Citricoccus nitrophenolicus TaxID=863575 RepID=A0ABV0IE89_9MICC
MTITSPSPHDVFTAIQTLAQTVPSFGTRAAVGKFPDGIVLAGGYVLPYCVIWPTPGGAYDPHPSVAGGTYAGGQEFRFMTTVSGADPLAVIGASGELKAVFTNAPMGDGTIRPVPEQQRAATVAKDPDSTPPRFGVALAWTVTTTRNPEQ